jgi:hypothetical protein
MDLRPDLKLKALDLEPIVEQLVSRHREAVVHLTNLAARSHDSLFGTLEELIGLPPDDALRTICDWADENPTQSFERLEVLRLFYSLAEASSDRGPPDESTAVLLEQEIKRRETRP